MDIIESKTILTYGTFYLLHYGHLKTLRRASLLRDRLIVGVSTDKFNEIKGKSCVLPYQKSKELLDFIDYVDKVIPEVSQGHKKNNIKDNNIDIFVIGYDWQGKFDKLKDFCEVIYITRNKGILSSKLKSILDE